MKQLLDRAPLIGSILAAIAAAATVVYLWGLGIVCRFSVLSRCDLSDYARLSAVWLAPILFLAVILVLLSQTLGKRWWLIVLASLAIVVAVLAVVDRGRHISPLRVPLGVLIVTVAALAALGVLVGLALRRSDPPRQNVILALGYAALVLIVALSSGISAGVEVMAAREPRIAVHVTGLPIPIRAVEVAQLHDVLILRALPDGKIYSVPQSRIQLIEGL